VTAYEEAGQAEPGKWAAGPKLGNLRTFLLERVDQLLKALEQKAVTDFNDWLVCLNSSSSCLWQLYGAALL
jgi:hypothetical protein